MNWIMTHANDPFPTAAEKRAMARTLEIELGSLNHLIYNTRKRMFPNLCKKKTTLKNVARKGKSGKRSVSSKKEWRTFLL